MGNDAPRGTVGLIDALPIEEVVRVVQQPVAMNARCMVGLGALVVFSSVAACDRPNARDDQPGQTTTTGASDEAKKKADAVGEKLSQAGDKVGEAATKAAVDVKQEAKKEWKGLDVHVDTGCVSCDGGAPSAKTR